MSATYNDGSNISKKQKINNNDKSILFHDISLIQEQEIMQNKNKELKNNFDYLFSALKKFKSNPNIFQEKNNNAINNNMENKFKIYLEKYKNKKCRGYSGSKDNSYFNRFRKEILIEDINSLSRRSNINLLDIEKKNLIFDDILDNNITDFSKTAYNKNGFISRNQNLSQRIKKIKHDLLLINFAKSRKNLNNNLNNKNKKHEEKSFGLLDTSTEELKKKFSETQKNFDKSIILVNENNTETYINKYKNEIKKKASHPLFNKVYKNSNTKNNILDILAPRDNNKLYKLLNNIPTRRKFHEKSVDVIQNISAINKTNRNYKIKRIREDTEKNTNIVVNLYNYRFNCVYPSNDYDIIKQQKNIINCKH